MSSTPDRYAPADSGARDDTTEGSSTRRLGRGWTPALRLARRTAWRHKGRTALIAALVALPVLGMSTISIVTGTSELTPAERADRLLGATDAYVEVTTAAVIDPPTPAYFGPGSWNFSGTITERDPSTVDLAALLPAGSQLIAITPDVAATVSAGGRLAGTQVVAGGLDGPLMGYRHRLLDGRVPAADGEVVLTESLATRLDVSIGSELTLSGSSGDGSVGGSVPRDQPATVVGLAVDATCLLCDNVYATRDAAASLADPDAEVYSGPSDFVQLPPGVDTVALWRDLAAVGVSFMPRDAILNPARYPASNDIGSGTTVETVAGFGLVVGFGLLEVVLLAGTAFAVGARRQVRELGLVAANGGEQKDVRRIVLAQGVVIGLVGGLAGVTLGFLPLLLGWSRWEQQAGHLFGSVVISPLQLAAIAAFGVVAGVLAAIIPARTAAKIPPMTALSGRFGAPTKPLRRPLLGVGLIVVGGVLSFAAAIRAHSLETAWEQQNAAPVTGGNFGPDEIPYPDTRAYVVAAVVGLAIMAAGLLIGAPALVSALSRLGRFFPLVPRLAMRDAGRHRHRTAPAICAVAIAVGGSVALGVVFSADEAESRRMYVPSLPMGWGSIYSYDEPTTDEARLAQQAAALDRAAELLGADRTFVREYPVVAASASNTPSGAPEMEDWTETVSVAANCEIVTACMDGPSAGDVVIGDADFVSALTGRPATPEIATALASGGAVVLSGPDSVVGGNVVIGTWTSLQAGADPDPNGVLSWDEGGGLNYRSELPAVAVPAATAWSMPGAVISAQTADDLGLTMQTSGALLSNDTVPTQDQIDKAQSVLTGALMDLEVERGFQSDATLMLLVLLGASALVTVASVAIAVGLAAAEGRADLATLAAVGADPRRRRILAMCQAAVVGLVGCLLGVAFGVFVAAVGLQGFGLAPWYVPWPLLGGIGFAVPLLAVVVAGLFTRSHLPLTRRVTA